MFQMKNIKIVPPMLIIASVTTAYFAISTIGGNCSNGLPRIKDEQEAVREAFKFLLKEAPDRLSLGSDEEQMKRYVEEHPNCCSASQEFSLVHWDRIWIAYFSLSGVVKGRTRKEDAVIWITSCREYIEMNWNADYS